MTRLAFTLLVTLIVLCIVGPTFLSDPPVRISIDSALPGSPASIDQRRVNTFPTNDEWAFAWNTKVTVGSQNIAIGYLGPTSTSLSINRR